MEKLLESHATYFSDCLQLLLSDRPRTARLAAPLVNFRYFFLADGWLLRDNGNVPSSFTYSLVGQNSFDSFIRARGASDSSRGVRDATGRRPPGERLMRESGCDNNRATHAVAPVWCGLVCYSFTT